MFRRQTTSTNANNSVGTDDNARALPPKLRRIRKRRQVDATTMKCKPGGRNAAFLMLLLFIIGLSGGLFVIHQILKTGVTTTSTSRKNESHNTQPILIFPPKFPIHHQGGQGIAQLLSQEALDMATKTLWHTIETTTIVLPDGETFIHTGDINDLWLRDSAAQIHPLLVQTQQHANNASTASSSSLLQNDKRLDRIVAGLIKRTAMYIRHDPYANAFRIDDSYVFSAQQKKMGRHDLISTWNYELDSACYYMRMLYFYYQATAKATTSGLVPADSVLFLPQVQQAVELMVDLWIAEQGHEDDHYPTGPLFDCLNCNKPYRYPGLPRNGKGSKTNSSAGMTWTGFRPSDDECTFGYHVPANMFAVAVLEYIVDLAQHVWKNPRVAQKAQRLAKEIQRGIEEHAIVHHPVHGKLYAYEVDGLGNALLMDDANVPSLLSIPYLGYAYYDETIYENTRRFIFSSDNPTYQKGNNKFTGVIEGYGSPHMSQAIRTNIWPMSLAMKGLTSTSVQEKVEIVEQLVQASAGTGWMHESINVNDPKRFTRSWFCWADSLFAELVMSLTTTDDDNNNKFPSIYHKYQVMEWRDPVLPPGGPYAADA
jgi:meiotically up-regulated gene 157 (Mug157) protein